VNLLHGLGEGDHQVIVATVVLLAAEFLRAKILRLQTRSHGTVEDQYLLLKCIQVAAICVATFHVSPISLARCPQV